MNEARLELDLLPKNTPIRAADRRKQEHGSCTVHVSTQTHSTSTYVSTVHTAKVHVHVSPNGHALTVRAHCNYYAK